jgi:hypothetical protein
MIVLDFLNVYTFKLTKLLILKLHDLFVELMLRIWRPKVTNE